MPAGPVILDADALDLGRFVRSGDGVVVGECCAEPAPLIDAVLALGGGLRVFLGLTFRDLQPGPDVELWSYGALGRTGRLPGLRIVPTHFSALPGLFARGTLPADVAMILVSEPDEHGRCSFGPGPEYVADVARHARVVLAEVSSCCPRTAGASIAYDELTAVLHTDRELVEGPMPVPGELEQTIAGHVATLVQDGDTIQFGVGALPEAIVAALGGHADLGVHSGMVSPSLIGLVEAGVVTNARKPVDAGVSVTGAALGDRRMLDALGGRADIEFRPTSHTHSPAVLAGVGRLAAINSAVEVDLEGNANGESVGGRPLGAIGGQADFLRAAAATGGTPILALPAKRIVARLGGPVSTSRADVAWVVTEHGARDLRGLTDAGRRAALIELAGPYAPRPCRA